MTQGAIDLVQAQLELEQAAAPDLTLLGPTGAQQALPVLEKAGDERGPLASQPQPRPLQHYSWIDAGSTIQLELPVLCMELGGQGSSGTMLACAFGHNSLDLRVTPAGGGAGTLAQVACAPGHRLLLQPLHAMVVPHRCSCYVKGALALPAHESGDEGLPQSSPASSAPESELHTVCFGLNPAAEAVVVLLAKAEPQHPWEVLQAAPALAARAVQPPCNRPDMAVLRCARRRGCWGLRIGFPAWMQGEPGTMPCRAFAIDQPCHAAGGV